MAGSTPTNRTVNIFINQASAERAMQNLQKQADKMTDAIHKGEKAGKDMTSEIEKLAQTKSKLEQLEGVISGKLAPSLSQVRARASELRRELDKMSADAPDYAAKFEEFNKVSARFKEMQAEVRGVGKAMDEVRSKGNSFWETVKGVAIGTIVGNTVQAATETIAGYFGSIVSGNAKLSDSLADVRKATGLTTSEVERLNSALSKIDTRTSHEELRKIAIGLGQIGEAATPETVAAIDKIVVALGDEFGGGAQEITTTLGTLRNNLQDIKTGNYADDMLHIGNALNTLGAEGLATAPVVVDFANRLAGIASTFGASSGQILGLSAALQELGVPAERGATAITKLLQKIAAETDKYADVAKYAGITTQDFAKLVNTDIISALTKFAEGARKAGTDNQTFGRILKDLDADGSGTGEVLSKLAKNAELLSGKIGLASNALKESSSITAEFDGKNNNLAATLEKIGKRMAAAFANSAIVNSIKSIIVSFADLVGWIDHTNDKVNAFREQQERVNSLESKITPLINRYDELTHKLNDVTGEARLSQEEHIELNKAIAAIGNTIPGAITQFDAWGNAIGISTQKAREYINLQRLVLQEKNRVAINEQLSLEKELDAKLKLNQKYLDTFVKEGRYVDPRVINNGRAGQEFADQTIKNFQLAIADLQNRLAGIRGIVKELRGEPLVDITSPTPPAAPPKASTYTTATDKEVKKAKYDLQKSLDDLNRYVAEQSKLAFDYQKDIYEQDLQASMDRYERQRQVTKQSYIDGKIDYKAYENEIGRIGQDEAADRARIDKEHADLVEKAAKDLEDAKTKALEEGVRKRKEVDDAAAKPVKKGKKEVDPELLALREKVDAYVAYAEQVKNILGSVFAYQNQKAQDALADDRHNNDEKKKNLQKQLDAGRISRASYDRQVEQLDQAYAKREHEERVKAFRRDQAIGILNAGINTAVAVTKALPNYVLAALVAAAGAVQVGFIAGQKPPKYGRGRRPQGAGGVPDGPDHANGGIDLVDPLGNKVGEMEGDEPILSRATYRNNRTLVDALLDSSMYGGGRAIQPEYLYQMPASLNVARAQDNIQYLRSYGNGGILSTTAQQAAASAGGATTSDQELKAAIQRLNDHLDAGITTNFVWTQFKKMKTQAESLEKAASLNALG